MRKIIISLIAIVALTANGQEMVNWRFQLEGMYFRNGLDWKEETTESKANIPTTGTYEAGTSLLLQIFLSHNPNRLFIETGIGAKARHALCFYKDSESSIKYSDDLCSYDDWGYYLDLPLRAGWSQSVGESSTWEFAIGPYLSYALFDPNSYYDPYGSIKKLDKFQVGINPSITYRHRCVSVGISYKNPLFYNGTNDQIKNSLTVTFGLNFKSGTWKYIGIGVASVATVGSAAYLAFNGSDSYSSSSSYTNSSVPDSYKGSDHDYMAQYSRWEKRAEEIIEGSDGHSMSASNIQQRKKLLRDAQKQMRKVRENARKRGVTIPKSTYETATINVY